MIDLRPDQLEIVKRILRERVPGCEVRAFGSRVDWTAKDRSDLDLAVVGSAKLDQQVMARIKEDLENSDLPFRVDVLDWHAVDVPFQKAIEKKCEVIQQGGRKKRGVAGKWLNLPFCDAVLVNPKVSLERGRPYPFVDMSAVSAGSRCAYATEERKFEGGGARFQHGDTLMARITPCLENGKIARFCAPKGSRVGYGSTEFIVVRGRPDVTDTDFAYYLTQWDEVRSYAIGQMTGTSGRQRVPTDSLNHLVVRIPPLHEQRAIAHILGTLDDRIELNRRMSETLEGMARALFQSWFVDFDPVRAKAEGRRPDGMDAATAALFPDSFENSELGEVPKGWRVDRFADHITADRGLSYNGAGLRDDRTGLPLHNLNSIYEGGGYKHKGIKYYAGEYRENHLLQTGNMIVTNTEQGFDHLLIGYAAIVPAYYGQQGLFSHHIFRVRPKQSSPFTPHYLVELFNSRRWHDWISGFANGTTINMLPKDALELPLLVVPPTALIEKYDALASAVHYEIEASLEQSLTLAALREALLPKLLNGELKVPVLEGQRTGEVAG